MSRATVYSIVLAPELRDAFLAAAEASGRPPAQVLRGLMREFIQRQQEAEAAAAPEVADDAAAEVVTGLTDAPVAANAAVAPEPEAAAVAKAAAAPEAAVDPEPEPAAASAEAAGDGEAAPEAGETAAA